MTRDYKLEACVVSEAQAVGAFKNGADRLEVCDRLETEGMTPAIDVVQNILTEVNIPVRVMIRETEFGFEANDLILEKMKSAIEKFKSLPVDGFVLGITKQNKLDRDAMVELIGTCIPLPVTIHKALDLSVQIEEDILWLNQFPTVDTILTSGGAMTARDGVEQILQLSKLFNGEVMAAGKILKEEANELHDRLGLRWYHGRGVV